MGKGESPTRHELQFIYELFDKGYSDAEVLREYGRLGAADKLGVLPYRNDIRFIRQRRREFEAAQGILEAKFKAKSIPTWVRQHWDDLDKVAAELDDMWIQHLESGRGIEDGDYIVDVDSAWFESFCLRHGYQMGQLLSHLKAEFQKEFEGIDSWRDLLKEPLPKECLHTIMLVSKRRTFEGTTCEICEGWQK